MKIRVGDIKVEMKDFLIAVLEQTDNKVIRFNLKDADYAATVKFTVNKATKYAYDQK